jgi:hypothetical protein
MGDVGWALPSRLPFHVQSVAGRAAATVQGFLRMTIRARKFIGTLLFVAFSICYFFFAISVAIARLPDTSTATQLLFYFVATLIWFVVCAIIIRWMQKP